MDLLKEQLKDFIIENYHLSDSQFSFDQSLVNSGIIDSMGIIEIVSFIEETYDIVIDDEEINTENFETINNMVQFIKSQKSN